MNKLYSYSLIVILLLITIPSVSAFSSRSDDYYLTITKQVADSHEWSYPSYICKDFTWDLMTKLNLNGFLSNKRIGYLYPCSQSNYDRFKCKHEWVEVWVGNNQLSIEPQSGRILTEEDFKVNYKK